MKPNSEYSIADAPQQNKTKLRHQPPSGWFGNALASVWRQRTTLITIFTVAAMIVMAGNVAAN